ncbi:alkyl hydroperoxide reductase [Mobiluncus mulieris]|uniref:Alkyl hydroperoxide reductase n=1 Tax=Mobiluncus mulieris TaxID=2052 RepID=A0ABD4TXX2_9ACTO|nr:alkyl hydroperoxide reductase [Mobiluncus mulieris]MCU9974120.1 alkyl hydroperoxide reductase [Mobiluncus mulieris]MCV0010259.1 alkyl hydroperoxide reductase [Mobiluncus mulieris]NMW75899.1 alkyl hydroperoxide reductase [Mobiluncus mulieris]NMX02064.1 alkyl hydroperoxide reductase [Mobiluncus mulieris]
MYYAIHSFDWARTGSYITITDRYDFGKGDLHSIEGVAIEIMYQAQQAGVLVPYYVSITRQ